MNSKHQRIEKLRLGEQSERVLRHTEAAAARALKPARAQIETQLKLPGDRTDRAPAGKLGIRLTRGGLEGTDCAGLQSQNGVLGAKGNVPLLDFLSNCSERRGQNGERPGLAPLRADPRFIAGTPVVSSRL